MGCGICIRFSGVKYQKTKASLEHTFSYDSSVTRTQETKTQVINQAVGVHERFSMRTETHPLRVFGNDFCLR